MRAAGRSMPTLSKIALYWADNAEPFPNLAGHALGWGEPFCFRCGWLAPIPDVAPPANDPWKYGKGWLERAHLADHALGGPDVVANIVPMCHVCHQSMPLGFTTTQSAVDWVNAWDPGGRNIFWQRATDAQWGGEKYRPIPGVKAVISFRLAVDERLREALAERDGHFNQFAAA